MPGKKEGCTKHRRSNKGDVLRHRSNKMKGSNRGGAHSYRTYSGDRLYLARAIDRIPDGRKCDRMADHGKVWDPHTGLFLRDPRRRKDEALPVGSDGSSDAPVGVQQDGPSDI